MTTEREPAAPDPEQPASGPGPGPRPDREHLAAGTAGAPEAGAPAGTAAAGTTAAGTAAETPAPPPSGRSAPRARPLGRFLPRPRLPRTVRGRRRAVRLLMAAAVLALLPSAWIHLTTEGRVRTVADAPPAPVAVVFGAGLRPDGEPSAWLAHRLDAAAELYHTGRVRALLVSGDNSREEYNEPAAMRRYLVAERGVPAGRVVADYAGFNTWNTCARAHDVFGVTRALLVTHEFHVRRALALCEAAGIEAWGVGVREWRSPLWIYSSLREMAAAFTAAWDVVFTPAPRFDGPPESGLRDILEESASDGDGGEETPPDPAPGE